MRTANYESGATSPPPKWSNRIKEVREERGHNQRQLARLAGLDAANLNAYEQGRLTPSVATLLRITQALECSLDDLVVVEDSNGDASA
jgi:transcriptional regulator with XRE-family HTH domain